MGCVPALRRYRRPPRAAGIVGSMLGGWLISPLVGAGTINQSDFSLGGLFVSLAGLSSCSQS